MAQGCSCEPLAAALWTGPEVAHIAHTLCLCGDFAAFALWQPESRDSAPPPRLFCNSISIGSYRIKHVM